MRAPQIGVLALQGDVREHVRALESVGASASRVRRPEELDAVDALVIPGGESTTIGKLLVTFALLEPLQKRVRDGMPAFGSCAGMILLADRVLDGTTDQVSIGGIDMTVRRNAFGRQVDSWESDLDVAGLDGGPLHAVFIRAPWVEDVGDGVVSLAQTANRIVAVRQGPLLATAFHPELTADLRMHALFVDLVKESVL
ncbi:MAG TPA: pyridoxal 5'-phosphate synthase glutaminase subunit PdxT [Mycobacteriales bacterium]|nr:pyridoxal 5'-phosphate synthase glutaminase subunit PdxT [Mycobacteriales bacterium]